MEFNALVKSALFPTLQKYGFDIAEEFKNVIRFQSSAIELNIVYNNFEESCYISIGKTGKPMYELRNSAVRELFNSTLSIEQVLPEIFVHNLTKIFETKEGASVLKGDVDGFIEFKITEDSNYTFELLQHQVLEIASKAWARNDYRGFIRSLDSIGIEKVPKSYKLKYDIARKKIL